MSNLLENGKTPEQWCETLGQRGIKLSPRTLRAKARAHAQFYTIGNLMLILPRQFEAILLAETEAEHAQSRTGR